MPSSASASPANAAFAASPALYPLDDFYAQAGRPLPQIEVITGSEVPEPCRTLLVHDSDMTSTLKTFHGSDIHLEVLRQQQRDDFYFREVVLVLDSSGARVEFGAIKINLTLFPNSARRQILEQRVPLGQILHEHHISHHSQPKAFLKIHSDDFINGALGLTGRHSLYGRRNSLYDSARRPLAEIVEILPPTRLPR